MFMRRGIIFATVSASMYPRRCHANSYIPKATNSDSSQKSYRQRFEKQNEIDNKLVIENYKQEITKVFGHPQVVSTLSTQTIRDLHFILVLYSKPLSPERRISLRKEFLPYLENSDKDTQKLFKYILKYYDVL